jgi:hypothetical protein
LRISGFDPSVLKTRRRPSQASASPCLATGVGASFLCGGSVILERFLSTARSSKYAATALFLTVSCMGDGNYVVRVKAIKVDNLDSV